LNSVELIHMNGRAFDYNLGRFLSVDPIIQFPTNSQSLNPYSYIRNNPLSAIDPSGYGESCIEGSSGGCKEELKVEKVEQTKSAPLGSRIKSVTTTTATLSNGTTISQSHDGAFAGPLTITPGNGAQRQTVTGSRLKGVGSSTIGSDEADAVNGISQPSNTFTTWDGTTATVEIMDFSETKRTLAPVDNPSDKQRKAAAVWAKILARAHRLVKEFGDATDKAGWQGVTYFLEASSALADKGSWAQVLQNRDSTTGAFTAKYMQLMRSPTEARNGTELELLFAVMHEGGHLNASIETWAQIVKDHSGGGNMGRWRSETDASARAFRIMSGAFSKDELRSIKNAGYSADHLREACKAAGL
jgi:RHS repeat-associated protein